jgi:hypothetical protein
MYGDHMKNTVHEYKVDTTDEPLQHVFDAAPHVTNAAVLGKVTCSLVK